VPEALYFIRYYSGRMGRGGGGLMHTLSEI
jgi:hypothetical protein